VKYFTKEWQVLCQHTHLHFNLGSSKQAETFSEEYFTTLYARKEKAFLKQQKEMSEVKFEDIYPEEGVADIPDFIVQRLSLTPEDIKAHNKAWLVEVAEARKNWTPPPPFDPEKAKKDFKVMYHMDLQELKEKLPTNIANQVADMRILALGKATAEVKKQIVAFGKMNDNAIEMVEKNYDKEFQKNFGDSPPAFMKKLFFHDRIVQSCKKVGDDVVLEFDYDEGSEITKIIFKNATILEQEVPLEGAWWLYEEIYPCQGGYEFHVMFSQTGGNAYFTVRASDIEYE